MPRSNQSHWINVYFAILLSFGVVSEANKEYWWMDDQSVFAPSSNGVNGGGGNLHNQPSQNQFNNGNNQHSSGGWNNNKPAQTQFNNGNNQHSSGGWNNGGSNGNQQTVVDPQPLRTPAPRRRPAPSQNNGCGGGGYGKSNCGNSLPAPSKPVDDAPVFQTECPAGSKCVAEHFCDANGVMSNTRVSLTHNQKQQRGNMIPCMMNQNTGTWGVCCAIPPPAPARQPSRPANNDYNNANNNQFGQNPPQQRPQQPKVRQQQQPNAIGGGSCPNVANLPPVEQCAGRASNCWSVGQPDVDCPGNALCCFDGCANTCQGGGGASPRQPSQSSPVSSNVGQGTVSNQQQFSQKRPIQNQVPQTRPQSRPAIGKHQTQTQIQSYPAVPNKPHKSYPSMQNGGGVRPSQQARPQNRQQQTRPQKRPQKARPPKRQQQPRPAQKARPQGNTRGAAKPQLSVMCPAAMLCVAKPNCDFKGVITDIPLNNLTPELEALRVPYISCVNPQDPSDSSTVCCRDPNYVDPWPNMNGGGGGGGRKNMKVGNNVQEGNGNGIHPRSGSASYH